MKVNVAVQTDWVALFVFATKKMVLLNFFVDHRKVNAVRERDPYPITGIEECVD